MALQDGLTLKATPNPSTASFTIYASSDNFKERITLRVIDLAGRIVEERVLTNNAPISLGERYTAGIYLVRIIQGDRQREIKLVKQ